MNEVRYISVQDAADIMNVCEATVRRWFSKGLKKKKVGNRYRIEFNHFLDFINNNDLSDKRGIKCV